MKVKVESVRGCVDRLADQLALLCISIVLSPARRIEPMSRPAARFLSLSLEKNAAGFLSWSGSDY
jgi:hypothetical protein